MELRILWPVNSPCPRAQLSLRFAQSKCYVEQNNEIHNSAVDISVPLIIACTHTLTRGMTRWVT